ncbi:putative immunity protein, partial [Streptococcus gordonii]
MDIYAYQRPLGKIEDAPDLKKAFIKIYEEKTHQEVVRFCQVYATYLSELTAFAFTKEMKQALTAMDDWLAGESFYHAARNLSFEISRLAKKEEDLVKVRFYRTMAQL